MNSTISSYPEAIDKLLAGEFPDNRVALVKEFASATGYEAYFPGYGSVNAVEGLPSRQVLFRETYKVWVLLQKDPTRAKGYSVFTAYPANKEILEE